MPANRLKEFVARLTGLEDKMTKHLEESGAIQTNIKWLTIGMYFLCGLGALILSAVLLHK